MDDVVPAHEASWDDVQAVFGTGGPAAECWCQRDKLARGEAFRSCPPEDRAARLRRQTSERPASGLISYREGEPVGWCAVEPRPAYGGLVRNSSRVAWQGRDEDRSDGTVWAVTCVLVRKGWRRQGVSQALVSAAVPYARSQGARALEGYPMTTTSGMTSELHPGPLSTFITAGFGVVSRPSVRRAIVRIDL